MAPMADTARALPTVYVPHFAAQFLSELHLLTSTLCRPHFCKFAYCSSNFKLQVWTGQTDRRTDGRRGMRRSSLAL